MRTLYCMKTLQPNWITNGMIDYEYKKYELLAYLQGIRSQFIKNKLYPYLSDLIEHYNNLVLLKSNKQKWLDEFPKDLEQINIQLGELHYRSKLTEDPLMEEIDEIILFAQKEMRDTVNDGSEIYEYVESNVEISPIGVLPLRKNEGYIFLHQQPSKSYSIYRYSMTIFEESKEKYRGMKTQFLKSKTYSRYITLESEKLKLVRKYSGLPNPAAYYITSTEKFPERETLFPIAKRYLIKYLSTKE